MSAESTPRPDSDATPSVVRRPWVTFWILGLIEFMTVLDTSIVNVALPSIKTGLGFTASGIAWIVDGYLLTYGGFMLLGGRVSDFIGRRRLFLIGVMVFAVASLACGLSATPLQLIASRIVQGLGAALVVPSALGLITDIFPEGPQRDKAFGIFSGMGGGAAAIGVVLGGLLTTVGWQWAFFINVPVGVAIIAAGFRMLPSPSATHSQGIDITGAVTATGSLCLLIYVIVQGGSQGWSSTLTIIESVGVVLLIGAFVIRQRTARAPLLPTVLLKRRSLVIGNAVMVLVGSLMFGTFLIITLYMQEARGYSPLQTGLMYIPIPVAILTGTQLAPRLAMRLGPVNTLMGGLLTQVAGLVWWAMVITVGAPAVIAFLLPAVVWGLGVGMSIVGAFIVCTMGVTPEVAGAASGLATTSNQVGGALGVAILAAVAAGRTQAILDSGSTASLQEALTGGYNLGLWIAAGFAAVAVILINLLRMQQVSRASSGSDVST